MCKPKIPLMVTTKGNLLFFTGVHMDIASSFWWYWSLQVCSSTKAWKQRCFVECYRVTDLLFFFFFALALCSLFSALENIYLPPWKTFNEAYYLSVIFEKIFFSLSLKIKSYYGLFLYHCFIKNVEFESLSAVSVEKNILTSNIKTMWYCQMSQKINK